MKTIEITKATGSLARYSKNIRKGPVVVTSRGKPVAALFAITKSDVDECDLSDNPRFLAILERSWAKYKAEGGISSTEIRKRLGIKKSA